MERSDIYEIIQYGRSLKLRMVMATCGYLIDEESIVKLKEAGISALSFSLDGSSAETNDEFRQADGAFDIAVRAAGIARQAGIPFQINTTISKINIGEVLGIAELARRLGANCFNPFILVPTGRGKNIADEILDPVQYEVLLNELLRIKLQSQIQVRVTCGPQFAMVCRQAKAKKLTGETAGCMGGRGFGFISYRGDVQTCGFLDIPAGNLVRNRFDFGRIWTKANLLKEVRDVSGYRGSCATCDFAGLCGGCRARAYVMTGDYLGSDPVCPDRSGAEKR